MAAWDDTLSSAAEQAPWRPFIEQYFVYHPFTAHIHSPNLPIYCLKHNGICLAFAFKLGTTRGRSCRWRRDGEGNSASSSCGTTSHYRVTVRSHKFILEGVGRAKYSVHPSPPSLARQMTLTMIAESFQRKKTRRSSAYGAQPITLNTRACGELSVPRSRR